LTETKRKLAFLDNNPREPEQAYAQHQNGYPAQESYRPASRLEGNMRYDERSTEELDEILDGHGTKRMRMDPPVLLEERL
jgi:hypothetical protein